MVVIDVNSGKFIGKKNHEENSLKINIEAGQEIIKQLKLRDIGGLIVIDFIDLEIEANRKKVYNELKKAIRIDGSKISLSELIKEMLENDLCEAQKEKILLKKGFKVNNSLEDFTK